MEYVIGTILALAIAGVAQLVGFDRDRSFYPTLLIVIAAYYVLFAVMSGAQQALVVELAVAAGLFGVAIVGFRKTMGAMVAGLLAHGLFDYGHQAVIANAAVPGWWPGFCLAMDTTLGLWLTGLLMRASHQPSPSSVEHPG